MQLCLLLFKDTGTSTFLLLLFEPLSIAFDTLQVELSPPLVQVHIGLLRASLCYL